MCVWRQMTFHLFSLWIRRITIYLKYFHKNSRPCVLSFFLSSPTCNSNGPFPFVCFLPSCTAAQSIISWYESVPIGKWIKRKYTKKNLNTVFKFHPLSVHSYNIRGYLSRRLLATLPEPTGKQTQGSPLTHHYSRFDPRSDKWVELCSWITLLLGKSAVPFFSAISISSG